MEHDTLQLLEEAATKLGSFPCDEAAEMARNCYEEAANTNLSEDVRAAYDALGAVLKEVSRSGYVSHERLLKCGKACNRVKRGHKTPIGRPYLIFGRKTTRSKQNDCETRRTHNNRTEARSP